jgi:Sec-independent protein secretion pathway component TatC
MPVGIILVLWSVGVVVYPHLRGRGFKWMFVAMLLLTALIAPPLVAGPVLPRLRGPHRNACPSPR